MKVSWTKGLTKELAAELRANFKESLVLRRRLVKLLEDKIDTSAKQARAESGYDNANWAYLQADARGYERALSDIISLIDENV